MNSVDKLVLLLGKILGVEWFKKYWPSEGSYWNKEHINKRSNHDLKEVIRVMTHLIQFHGSQFTLQLFAIATILIFGIPLNGNGSLAYCLLNVYHSYALLCAKYNIVRAQRTIDYNTKNKCNVDDMIGVGVKGAIEITDPLQHTKFKVFTEDSLHYIQTRNSCINIGYPYVNLDDAIAVAHKLDTRDFQTVLRENYHHNSIYY